MDKKNNTAQELAKKKVDNEAENIVNNGQLENSNNRFVRTNNGVLEIYMPYRENLAPNDQAEMNQKNMENGVAAVSIGFGISEENENERPQKKIERLEADGKIVDGHMTFANFVCEKLVAAMPANEEEFKYLLDALEEEYAENVQLRNERINILEEGAAIDKEIAEHPAANRSEPVNTGNDSGPAPQGGSEPTNQGGSASGVGVVH